jgi:hypothetical protein
MLIRPRNLASAQLCTLVVTTADFSLVFYLLALSWIPSSRLALLSSLLSRLPSVVCTSNIFQLVSYESDWPQSHNVEQPDYFPSSILLKTS